MLNRCIDEPFIFANLIIDNLYRIILDKYKSLNIILSQNSYFFSDNVSYFIFLIIIVLWLFFIIIPFPLNQILMNFTILGRNSTAGPVYTDRPSSQYTSTPEPWKKPPY